MSNRLLSVKIIVAVLLRRIKNIIPKDTYLVLKILILTSPKVILIYIKYWEISI